MPDQLLVTRLLNQHLAGPVDALLNAVGVHPRFPTAPISNAFALELLIAAAMVVFFVWVRATLSVDKPAPVQQLAEMVHEFVGNQANEIIGHGYERFQSFATIVFVFILICNLIGLVPGINSPTETLVVTVAIALATFVYYNFYGLKEQGFLGYMGHLAGPVWWLAWLIFPIEVISHVSRIMSLSVRLFANMFAGTLVTLVFFSLIPVGVPVVFLVLHFIVSVVQAFVFMLLVMIYLSVAVSHEH
jgi:F-type H+-transporting ATPase subunit a